MSASVYRGLPGCNMRCRGRITPLGAFTDSSTCSSAITPQGRVLCLMPLLSRLVVGFSAFADSRKGPGIDPSEVRIVAYPHLDSYTFEKQFVSRIECSGLLLGKSITWARELQREGGRTTTEDAKAISDAARDAEERVRTGEEITLPLICTYGTERLWFEKGHRTRKTAKDGTRRTPSRFDGYRDCFNFTIQETALLEWIRDARLPSRFPTSGTRLRSVWSSVL